jgi:hypothetical protein
MAIGDPYASLADLKSYLKITGSADDTLLTFALQSASTEIERHCGRQFNQQATATARIYEPDTWKLCYVDDFFTLTGFGIVTDPGGTNNFTNTLTAIDYEPSPLNAMVQGQPWVYTTIRSTGGNWFPKIQFRRRGTMQVTAQWGWASVPAPVHQACLIIAAQEFRMKDAPFGVAGMTEFGAPVKVVTIPKVVELLRKFQRYQLLGG